MADQLVVLKAVLRVVTKAETRAADLVAQKVEVMERLRVVLLAAQMVDMLG
jgi:hypothetical protein